MEAAYVLVPLGVLFLCCQLILCRVARFCPWSNHWLFLYAAEAGNFLPNLLGSMAIGSIPDEASAVVLMLFLVLLNNSLAVYDREKTSPRYLFTVINCIWFCYKAQKAIGSADDDLGSRWRCAASAIVIAMLCAYVYCNIIVGLASTSKDYSEAVAEHMEKQDPTPPYNPSTLKGYRYVVLLEPEEITVDEIFGGEGQGEEGEQRQEKDLCLSFSLFQLLFCLYHGVPWYNGNRSKCWKLVVRGLLGLAGPLPPPPPPLLPPPQLQQQQQNAHYERAFRVAEVELAFLHDHVHGGDILWSPGSAAWRAWYYVLKIAMAVIMYFVGIGLYLTWTWDRHSLLRVLAPLLLYLLFDLLQVVFYCRSDRRMVSRMCRRYCCNNNDVRQRQYFDRFISFVRRPAAATMNNGSHFYRLERLGQYSLLEETTLPRSSISFPWSCFSHNAKPSGHVLLPHAQDLKRRVAEVLGGSICQVRVPAQVEAAAKQLLAAGAQDAPERPKEKIDIILKWHIATSYCEMLDLQAGPPSCPEHVVAVLSRYCAYLVAFRPELLPCPVSETKSTFSGLYGVLQEVRSLVGGVKDRGSRLHMLRTRIVAPCRGYDDILIPGLQLGHYLFTEIENREDLWAILESMWLNLILGVAPQESRHDASYAKSHAKYLAQGGEFLTYLWALLSHAGIQKHSSWPPCIRDRQVVPWASYH